MADLVLLWIVTGLLFLGFVLRILLMKKRGDFLKPVFLVQGLLFPAAMLTAVVLLQGGKADIVIPVVILGIAEELIFSRLQKRVK